MKKSPDEMPVVETGEDIKFNKRQILAQKKYAGRSDILGVLLKDSEYYSSGDIEIVLREFMKGKVKG